ncbi:hypothetical protein FRB90_012477 [Tulasnella sp. 427]|nr:hypothetical protein FRB90_012477 [Tulasnella sp. 427]
MWSTGVPVSKDSTSDHSRRLAWLRHRTTWYDYIKQKEDQGEKYAQKTRELITAQIRSVLDGVSPSSTTGASTSEAVESFFDANDAD